MRNWGRDVSAERGVYCVYMSMCASRYLLLRPSSPSFPFTWNGEIGIDCSGRDKLHNRVMHIILGYIVVSHHLTST